MKISISTMDKKPANFLENEYVKFWIEDGILMETIKVSEIDLPIAQVIISDRIKISAGIRRPMLVDVSMLKHTSKEARQYFATHERQEDVSVVAILASNPVTLMGSKLYLLIEKPITKTEVFLNRKKAIQWLKGHAASETIPQGSSEGSTNRFN